MNGKQLKRLLKRANIKIIDFCEKFDYKHATISKYTACANPIPHREAEFFTVLLRSPALVEGIIPDNIGIDESLQLMVDSIYLSRCFENEKLSKLYLNIHNKCLEYIKTGLER